MSADAVVTGRRAQAPALPTRSDVATARRSGLLPLAAAATCVLAPALVAFAAPGTARLAGVFAMLVLAPGTAVLELLRPGGRHEPGLVVGLSLGLVVVLAQAMLWLDAWSPEAALDGLAAGCLVALGAAWRFGPGVQLSLPALRRPAAVTLAHGTLVAAVFGLWALSLAHADLGRMDGLGLLQALPIWWYAAFALLLGGFAAAVTSRELNPVVLTLYVLGLVALLHATAAALYDVPRFTWTYKHLGVTELIGATGHAHRLVDIYGNWPGFFAAGAWLSGAAGVAPIHFAGWAEAFFSLVDAAAVAFAVRGVTRDPRLIWAAVWLFLVADWVGQTYYAPQALGFVLVAVIIGLCLRCAPVRGSGRPRRQRPDAPLSVRAALGVGGLCYLAVVVSHQLSPVMALLAVFALALIARRVPLWVPLVMLAVELWWLALSSTYLREIIPLYTSDKSATPRPPGNDLTRSPDGFALVVNASHVLVVILVALTIVGLVRRRRAGWRDRAARVLIIAPVAALAAISYGGEEALRVYLFALPWLALGAASACLPQVRPGAARRRSGRPWGLAAAGLALGACALFADFGYELANRIDPSEVRTSAWLEHHAPRGTAAMYLINAFPARVTADYPRLRPRDLSALADAPRLQHRPLGAIFVPVIEKEIRAQWAGPAVIVLGPTEDNYARLYGILPAGAQASLERALHSSRDFRLLHRDGPTSVFAYLPTWR